MTKQTELIAYVFDLAPPLDAALPPGDSVFSGELLWWMEGSARFSAFVETYRDKIRKKIRTAREPGSLLDLRAELDVACRLLNDRHLALAYEPYASAKKRGPDFAVTYRANLVINLEIAHLRAVENEAQEPALLEAFDPADPAEPSRKEGRLLRILLDKLGQMQPGMPNLLAIQTRPELARILDLERLMREVKTRSEGKDPVFYAASRYASPAAFYKDFLHLSGIVLWASAPANIPSPPSQLWINKQARPALPEKVLRLVSRTLDTPPLPKDRSPV